MVGFSCEAERWVCMRDSIYRAEEEEETTTAGAGSLDQDRQGWANAAADQDAAAVVDELDLLDLDEEDVDNNNNNNNNNKKKKNQVLLEGYVSDEEEEDLKRTKSLTDEDLDELKGCVDLGFGFSYEEIPELCNTLPALELCYSMSQKYLDDHHKSPHYDAASPEVVPTPNPIANWKISSPGDHPEDVKARLKFWAQAVACTVRLCS